MLNIEKPGNNLKTRKSKAWYIKNSSDPSILDKHLGKLPLCKNFIDRHSESIEEFQRRRILAAINYFLIDHSDPPVWKIVRRAGIRQEYLTDELMKFINKNKENLINGSKASNHTSHP